jgi:hypothetical protein
MQRVSSVSEVTRNSVNYPGTDDRSGEKRNPPGVLSGGPQMRVSAGAGDAAGVDLASAFLAVVQARFRVTSVMDAERRILARRARGEAEIPADERGEHIAIFGEGFEVLQATWPPPVRDGFARIFGCSFEAFDQALTVLGETLYETAVDPRPVTGMITPATFEAEGGR